MLNRQTDRIAGMDARFLLSTAATLMLCTFLFACTRNDTLPSSTLQAFEQTFNRDDLAGCVALFTDDAQILPEQGPVISGKAEIEEFLKNQLTPVVLFDTQTELVLVRGDLAMEQGEFKVRDIRHGSDIELGKYVHIWRKMDGDWKLFRVIYNTNIAPKTEVSVEPVPKES